MTEKKEKWEKKVGKLLQNELRTVKKPVYRIILRYLNHLAESRRNNTVEKNVN